MKTKRVNMPTGNQKAMQDIDDQLTNVDICKKEGFLETAALYKSDKELIRQNAQPIGSSIDNAWEFVLYLAIGIKEAAFYIAMCFLEGYGVIQNEFLSYLSMAIGVKLGDKQTIELVGNEKLPNDTLLIADECVAVINKNALEVGNRQITYEEGIGRAKLIDKILQNHSKATFEDNTLSGGLKDYAKYVDVMGEVGDSSGGCNCVIL